MSTLTVIVIVLTCVALLTLARRRRLWWTGVHTEDGGPGRVRFLSIFRGAGYCVVLRRGRGRDGRPRAEPGWRPNITLRGFTIYLRTKASRRRPSWGRPVGRLRITTNGNHGPVV